MTGITPGQRRQAEQVMLNYPAWKSEYDSAYEQIAGATPARDGLPQGGGFSGGSRQERLVIKMESRHFLYLQKNIQAVDAVMGRMREEYRRVIRYRYFGGRKMPYNLIARKCFMSERTVRRIVTRFLTLLGQETGITG